MFCVKNQFDTQAIHEALQISTEYFTPFLFSHQAKTVFSYHLIRICKTFHIIFYTRNYLSKMKLSDLHCSRTLRNAWQFLPT
ncbi:CLUMA_CG008281, isoform A [Clunio marinus]|uniref:CLUMA_CG008281, isoform A n=1 Tax=Clunio marinus TaxID=568069 RepID=A0A1J1I3L5_9DIPT|nr:CLUMA_CG008281, isoform A [Clunio marinus]